MELERREHEIFTMRQLGKTSYVNFSSLLTTSKFAQKFCEGLFTPYEGSKGSKLYDVGSN